MKAAVIVFPGTNREGDVCKALKTATGSLPALVWHGDHALPEADLIVVPGGFAHGDYLRAGAMAAHSPVMAAVVERARKGVPVLGICNGFQILTETGLLPGMLMRNAGLKFVCRDVHLRVDAADTVFTRGYREGQVIRIPVAHHEGNYFADEDTLERLFGNGQVAFRYCHPSGEVAADANPNGSRRNIAGILDDKRTVLGLMPHPDRLADAALGGTDGRAMFDGLVEALAA